MRIMNCPFTVKTLTGLLSPCVYQTAELNIPDLYHCVWNHLPDELRQEARMWNLQLLVLPAEDGEGEGEGGESREAEQEQALLEVVQQGGLLYLLVHTDHLEAHIQLAPFDFTCPLHPGVTFVRRVFKACYRSDRYLSWRVEAYVGVGEEGLLLYHVEDVDREIGAIRQFSPCTKGEVVTCTNVLDLIVRAYDYHWRDWYNTPYRLLPALYETWTQLLHQELNA